MSPVEFLYDFFNSNEKNDDELVELIESLSDIGDPNVWIVELYYQTRERTLLRSSPYSFVEKPKQNNW